MAQAPSKPPDRNGFKVAIICAMPLEAEMVELVFDKYWKDDGKRYGKAPGDLNAYTTGMIGNHNVVLTCPSSMDIKNAAVAPAYLRTSFQGIDIVFIVGVCGVVPIHLSTMVEIVLGDCIISTSIVQYDLGKLYPNGFVRKTTTEDSFSRASIEVRSLTSMLMTRRNRRLLTERLIYHLSILKELESDILYSGAKRDRLFEVSYNHQHRKRNEDCNLCILGGTTCLRDCDSIGCANEHTIQRQRFKLENDDDIPPQIYFGRFGSSNTLMKSGTDRDNIARNAELIAFEMESLGVWNSFPTIVIKSACNDADSHKNKEWQLYAAATAAAGLKAVLENWEAVEQPIHRDLPDSSLPEHGAGLNDSAGKQVLIARQEDSQHTVTAESKADFNQSLERAQGYNGRWQKAEVFYKRTVAVEEIFLGFTHSKVLDTVFCLGCHYLNYGNLSEAEKLFVRASRDREAPGANQRIKLDTDEIWMKN